MKITAHATVLLGLVAVPAICGAQTASKAATTVPDPCSLVTKQEAAMAVGEPVGDGKSTIVDTKGNQGLQGGGSYAFEAPSTTHYLKVNLYRYPPAIAAAFKNRCAQKETVPGVGDVACWYNANHQELQLLKGTTSLSIQISRRGDAAEALKTVARAAASRLP
jgi:hypothetical protein